MERKQIIADEEICGLRLDKAISTALDLSRKNARDWIDDGRITVNARQEKPKYIVNKDDVIDVEIPDIQSMEVQPEPMDLNIVYEDHDIIIINKPKGLVVHPAPGHYSGTLVNGLLAHCKDLSGINGIMRPGIVHRIDKDTSGLLVVCKNDKAHTSISEQLQDKTCHREYVAIVHKPFSHTYGTVDAPIGRDTRDRQKMAVISKNSKAAVTHFQVLENFANYAYIQCKLETGRTHQIRVHMQYIGHPIVGDPKYGYRKSLKTNGQLLHASALELIHPTTLQRMRFEAEPDQEFQKILKQLQNGELQ